MGMTYKSMRIWAALSILLIGLVFYASSGTIQWGDDGAFLIRAARGGYFSPELLAMSHPLYTLVVAIVYKLGGAVGVSKLNFGLMVIVSCQVYWLARQLNYGHQAALVAVLSALCVHVMLWVATKVEVYMLHLVVMLGCYAVYLWQPPLKHRVLRMITLGFLTGLAVSTHQLTFLLLLPLVVMLVLREFQLLHWYALGTVFGLFPCYVGFFNDVQAGKGLFAIVRAFLTNGGNVGAGWESELFRFDSIYKFPKQVAPLVLSLVGVGIFGMFRMPRAEGPRVIWISAWVNFLFAASYNVGDRYTFFLPGAVVFAIFGALYLKDVALFRGARVLMSVIVLAPIVVLHLTVMLADSPALKSWPTSAFVAEHKYLLAPLLKDESADVFVSTYETMTSPGDIVFADWNSSQALLSAQEVGRFQQRTIVQCERFSLPLVSMYRRAFVAPDCRTIEAQWQKPVAIGTQIRISDAIKNSLTQRLPMAR
jgi:hypothetical protein